MGKSVKISIKKEATDESILVEGVLSEEDIELFKEYIEYSDDLIKCAYFKYDKQASLNFKGKAGEGTTITAHLPPDEACDSMILKLRPFVLRRERTSFENISSRINRIFDADIIKFMLRNQSDLWTGKHFRSQFRVEDNHGVLNSDKTIMDYLNAFVYHRDKKKQERLEWPKKFLGDHGLKAFFMIFLLEKAKAIMNMADFCKIILGEVKKIRITTD